MEDTLLSSLSIIIPTFIGVILLIIIAFVLYEKNKNVNRVLTVEKKRLSQYQDGIKKLNDADFENPEKYFDYLNKYVRGFFKEYYNLEYSLTYLELKEIFKRQNDNDYSKFCERMSIVDYSGTKKKKDEIKYLAQEFLRLIEKF